MLFHIFRHVQTQDGAFIVKQELSQRLGEFGLADAGGADKDERSNGAVGVLQACTSAAYRIGHRFERVVLSDHAGTQVFLHGEELFALTLHHLVDRHTGPAADDRGDGFFIHDLFHQALLFFGLGVTLGRSDLAFQFGDERIFQLSGLVPVRAALGIGQLGAGAVELFLGLGGTAKAGFFSLPGSRDLVGLGLKVADLGGDLGQTLLGGIILFLLEGLLFDLELHQAPVDLVEFFRLGFNRHAQAGGSLVHQVDGFVRHEAVGNVAVGQGGGGHDGGVRDADSVVHLVFFLQSTQDGDRVLDGGFLDEHRLETTGEGGVLLHMLAIFIQRGGADTVQFPACEGWLEQVGGIHCAIGFSRTNQRVHLVDEQDDRAFCIGNFCEDGLEAFLELTTIFGAGNQRAHVEGEQAFVLQAVRHIAIDDAQGQALGDGGFTDAGFTDQDRIVLCAA